VDSRSSERLDLAHAVVPPVCDKHVPERVHLKQAEPLRRPGDGRVSGGRAHTATSCGELNAAAGAGPSRQPCEDDTWRRGGARSSAPPHQRGNAHRPLCPPPPTDAAVRLHRARSARARAYQALRAVLVNHDAARAERNYLP
jgi:hypothetical protein